MILIGIAGGSGSGKTTLANRIHNHFGESNSQIISQDNYYKDQSDKFDYDGGSVNFDHPDAIDFDLLAEQMRNLINGNTIHCPIYDFATHKRLNRTIEINPKKIIILDGILIFTHQKLLNLFHHKIFTDCEENIRYERRLKRDVKERGRTEEGVRKQFHEQVKPMHDEFVQPSSNHADEIITQHSFDKSCDNWIERIQNLI